MVTWLDVGPALTVGAAGVAGKMTTAAEEGELGEFAPFEVAKTWSKYCVPAVTVESTQDNEAVAIQLVTLL